MNKFYLYLVVERVNSYWSDIEYYDLRVLLAIVSVLSSLCLYCNIIGNIIDSIRV
jgi:hypothetical protein